MAGYVAIFRSISMAIPASITFMQAAYAVPVCIGQAPVATGFLSPPIHGLIRNGGRRFAVRAEKRKAFRVKPEEKNGRRSIGVPHARGSVEVGMILFRRPKLPISGRGLFLFSRRRRGFRFRDVFSDATCQGIRGKIKRSRRRYVVGFPYSRSS